MMRIKGVSLFLFLHQYPKLTATIFSNCISLALCFSQHKSLFINRKRAQASSIIALDANRHHNDDQQRRHFLVGAGSLLFTGASVSTAALFLPQNSWPAPPISIISEELGYYPVTTKDGEVTFVPKRVTRKSSPQAIELAKMLSNEKFDFKMYGAFWCPHCSRQKELFGASAWSFINYVECAPKGYNYKRICKNVDGFPTFELRGKGGEKIYFSGERDLEYLADQINFNFDPSLESDLPAAIGASCKLR